MENADPGPADQRFGVENASQSADQRSEEPLGEKSVQNASQSTKPSPGSVDQHSESGEEPHGEKSVEIATRSSADQFCEEPAQSAAVAGLSPPISVHPAKRLKFALRSSSAVEETKRRYFVRFEGNNSKKWDGRQIMFDDSEWLESMYSLEDLCPGKVVELPYEEETWRAVMIDSTASESLPEPKGEEPAKGKGKLAKGKQTKGKQAKGKKAGNKKKLIGDSEKKKACGRILCVGRESDDASHLEGTGSSLAEDTTAKTDQHPDNPEPSRKPRQPRQKKTDRVDEMCKLAVHTCTF